MKKPIRPIATSAEVARVAGVSRTTVSFVLNDIRDRGISDITRERVLAVARELGYEPNAAARSLAGGVTRNVALVVPQLQHLAVDAFLAQLVASVDAWCHLNGLRMLIESMEGEGREPGGFLQLVSSRSIDGLIVANPRTQELEALRQLRDRRTPLVLLGSELHAKEGFQTIGHDTRTLPLLPVEHLLRLGHRRVGMVNYAPADYQSALQRDLAWREALSAASIDADPRWCAHGNISARSGYLATRELLTRKGRLDALFAGNDTIAFGMLRALQEAGLRVPDDIAVVGYDDIPLAAFASPPLTTVQSDAQGHGRLAVQRLLAQMREGEAAPLEELQAPRLVVRHSCGAPPEAQEPAARTPPAARKRAARRPVRA